MPKAAVTKNPLTTLSEDLPYPEKIKELVSVMVNLMRHLDWATWCPAVWWNVALGVSGTSLTLESVDGVTVKPRALPSVVASAVGRRRASRSEKAECHRPK